MLLLAALCKSFLNCNLNFVGHLLRKLRASKVENESGQTVGIKAMGYLSRRNTFLASETEL